MFDYEAILADHHRAWLATESYIQDDTFSIGMEMSAPVASQNANSTTVGLKRRTFAERIKSGIDSAMLYIEELITKLTQTFRKFLLTTQGFNNQLIQAKKQTKPLKGLKVIMYSYNDQFLDDLYIKMTNLANKYIITNENIPQDSPLLLFKDQFELFFIKELSGEEIDPNSNFANFMMNVKKRYRGDRKEVFVGPNQLSLYIRKSNEYPKLKRVINNDLSMIKNRLNSMKSMIRSTQTVDDRNKKQDISKANKNAIYFSHCYSTMANMYFNLKFEQVFQCRAIIKRFYAF